MAWFFVFRLGYTEAAWRDMHHDTMTSPRVNQAKRKRSIKFPLIPCKQTSRRKEENKGISQDTPQQFNISFHAFNITCSLSSLEKKNKTDSLILSLFLKFYTFTESFHRCTHTVATGIVILFWKKAEHCMACHHHDTPMQSNKVFPFEKFLVTVTNG